MINIFEKIINLFRKRKSEKPSGSPSYTDYSHTYNSDGNFEDDFYLNLQKTIAWTEKIISQINDTSEINYSRVLRSTNPVHENEPFYKFESTWFRYPKTPDIPFNYNTVLLSALHERQESALPLTSFYTLGRILKFEIDLTTHDGAPCSVSDGFVDESDIPPIDTWFYITKKYLYCWIPTMFGVKMQDAIDVEILDSYTWLDEINPELNSQILKSLEQSQNG